MQPVVSGSRARHTGFGIVSAVIRWHSSSRRRADGAVSAQLLGWWAGRLALLAVALGLVLMHHVVGAHQHSGSDVTLTGSAPLTSVADDREVPPGGHHGIGDAVAHAGAGQDDVTGHGALPATFSAGAALLHRHPDGNGHDPAGALLHLCLVALVGAAVLLLVLVLVALWWRTPPRRSARDVVGSMSAPRAPPTSSRLAELQVLRL